MVIGASILNEKKKSVHRTQHGCLSNHDIGFPDAPCAARFTGELVGNPQIKSAPPPIFLVASDAFAPPTAHVGLFQQFKQFAVRGIEAGIAVVVLPVADLGSRTAWVHRPAVRAAAINRRVPVAILVGAPRVLAEASTTPRGWLTGHVFAEIAARAGWRRDAAWGRREGAILVRRTVTLMHACARRVVTAHLPAVGHCTSTPGNSRRNCAAVEILSTIESTRCGVTKDPMPCRSRS